MDVSEKILKKLLKEEIDKAIASGELDEAFFDKFFNKSQDPELSQKVLVAQNALKDIIRTAGKEGKKDISDAAAVLSALTAELNSADPTKFKNSLASASQQLQKQKGFTPQAISAVTFSNVINDLISKKKTSTSGLVDMYKKLLPNMEVPNNRKELMRNILVNVKGLATVDPETKQKIRAVLLKMAGPETAEEINKYLDMKDPIPVTSPDPGFTNPSRGRERTSASDIANRSGALGNSTRLESKNVVKKK